MARAAWGHKGMVPKKSACGHDNAGMSEDQEPIDEVLGEDDEPLDEGPGAWQRYVLWTLADGKIEGQCSTNDNLDTGYPNEYADWKVSYKDKASMLKNLSGGSHVGISGVRVSVELDGDELGHVLARRGEPAGPGLDA